MTVHEDRGTALCLSCGWSSECDSARAALGVGAQHSKRLGHRVSVELTTTVVYEKQVVVEGQESLIG